MKMRKKLAALLAAAMIASVMPMTAFASSDNRVTKTVSVAKDKELKKEDAPPQLNIKLKDDLVTAQAFYLNLTNAEWLGKEDLAAEFGATLALDGTFIINSSDFIEPATGSDADKLKITRTGSKTLRVEAEGPANAKYVKDTVFKLPIYAKLKGGEATIEVESADTVVDSSKHVFATSSDSKKATVTVGDAKYFVNEGKIGDISFEEPFIGAFKDATSSADTSKREVTIELRDSDFSFDISGYKLENNKGFGISTIGSGSVRYATKNGKDDKEVIIVTLPNTATATQRGTFTLKDVKVVRTARGAAKGDIKATIRGELIDGTQEVVLAKYGDYTTKLATVKEEGYEAVTGGFVEVEFKLTEEVKNSLLKNRDVTFSFSKGIKILENSVQIKANDKAKDIDGVSIGTSYRTFDVVDTKDKHNSFVINSFGTGREDDKVEYTFKAKLLVPNTFDQDEIKLTADGRALSETHEITVAKVKKSVDVEVTPIDIKVGLQKQVGGKIVIKENFKEAILKSYKDAADKSISNAEIIIEIGDDAGYTDGLRITDADIKVTEGDLVLDLDEKVVSGGVIRIPVKRQSTAPSTIEITNIEVTATRTVPEGKYNVKVGGAALSKNTELKEFYNDKSLRDDVNGNFFFDPIVAADFINITTKNTEDIKAASAAEVSFVVGSTQYLVNGKAETMDAVPYVKDGRTMVPVRYVAAALGITGDKVVWDGGTNQTATILADKVIQVKLGSKTMVVNGANVPMSAAAELKDGRVCVPVAEIARALGVTVEWNEATKTATFNPKN